MLLGIFLAGLRAALVLGVPSAKETNRFTPANSFAAMRARSWIFANHGFHFSLLSVFPGLLPVACWHNRQPSGTQL